MSDKIDRENGQNENDEDMMITLEFEDGENVVVEPLFIFNFEDKDYIALVPVDEDSEDVYLYIYHELDDDEFEFMDIEDDDEFDRVAAEFERIIEETQDLDGEE